MMKQLTIFFLALVVAGCSKKRLPDTAEEYSLSDAETLYTDFQNKQADFSSMEASVKTRYQGEDKALSFRLVVRIKKDEKIWLSARLLGFEGVRALVTPDSVKVINRLENTYYLEPIGKIEEITQLPVDFQTFQNLLTGNLLVYNERQSSVEETEEAFQYSSRFNQLINTALLNKQNLTLLRQQLKDNLSNQTMSVEYDDLEPLQDRYFPTRQQIQASTEGESVRIELNFSDISLNEDLSFPFNISDRYEQEEY